MPWCLAWRVLKSSSHLQNSTSTKSSKIFYDNHLLQKILSLEISVAFMGILHNSDKKLTVSNLINYWHQRFKKERITEPKESIEHIIAHVLGITQITNLVTINKKELTKNQLERLEQLCECRLLRMPVQYIIGKWDFQHITLKLEPPIFIPRPETEIMVDILLNKITSLKNSKCNILEIGCGSGAISLSLLHSNKDINLVAIDINSHACELTITNARNLQIENRLIILNAILKSDGIIEIKKEYFSKQSVNFHKDKFEYIISNPPYIPTKTLFKLQPEIKLYEDLKALDGGNDGLKLIIPILKYASEALNVGGFLFLEVDSSHPEKIKCIINQNYTSKLKFERVHKDFCNKERIVEILKIG